jgi:hypothetical protein
VDEDVNAAEALADGIDDRCTAFDRGDVSGNEHLIARLRTRSRCDQDLGAQLSQPSCDRCTDALGAACDVADR